MNNTTYNERTYQPKSGSMADTYIDKVLTQQREKELVAQKIKQDKISGAAEDSKYKPEVRSVSDRAFENILTKQRLKDIEDVEPEA